MIISRYFEGQLSPHVLQASNHFISPVLPKGILLLDTPAELSEDTIYIGFMEQVQTLISLKFSVKHTYIFIPAVSDISQFQNIPDIPDTFICLTDLTLPALYNSLYDITSRLGIHALAAGSYHKNFADFFNDVITMKLTREDEILEAIQAFNYVPHLPYRIYIFEPTDSQHPLNGHSPLINELAAIFPYSNIIFYYNQLILFAQPSSDKLNTIMHPSSLTALLENLCKKYHVYCAASHMVKNYAMIRTLYLQAKNILQMGRRFDKETNRLLFLNENFAAWQILHLAYEQYCHITHHNNYTYMLHPGVTVLIQYDIQTSNNLHEVLYTYLLNDRSITRTASIMYMHRNTILNKVNKALELVSDDIDNPVIRQHILMSLMLAHYCDTILDIPPESFKSYDDRSELYR